MNEKEAKHLIKDIFGEEAANDKDIVQFYLDVNKIAMNEFAIEHLKEVMNEIASELKDYKFNWQRDEVNIIEEHIKLINNKIEKLQ